IVIKFDLKKYVIMKTRQVLIIISSIILLSLISFIGKISYESGVSYGEKNAEEIRLKRIKTDFKDSIIPKYVNTKTIFNDTIPFTINGSGRVISSSNINISSEVQGKLISNINLKKGTEFTKGQILFKVKDDDAQLLLIAKKSNFLNLVSNSLADIKIDFSAEFLKWDTFFNSIKVNSPLPVFPSFSSTKEKNFIISRSFLSEYYSIKSDEERLKKYLITAPFNGSIIEAFTDEGAVVNPGSPIVNIIRKGDLEIEIPINPDYISKVKKGYEVILTQDNNQYSGSITRIGDFVNANTQNLSVFAKLVSNNNNLLNGMYLEASIKCDGFENVVKIPRKAVFGNNMIFTVNEDSLLIPKKINVKSMQNNLVLASGIENATILVIEPVINAKDSMKVYPIN
ncbi:HlyD family efflux transporter periplasmic adaptor subunit, partial [Flavobacteriales bacterium]|nr:HlyD family efflux transporter periplasmic adaptor subunit [Flavobacteriales bacterium]